MQFSCGCCIFPVIVHVLANIIFLVVFVVPVAIFNFGVNVVVVLFLVNDIVLVHDDVVIAVTLADFMSSIFLLVLLLQLLLLMLMLLLVLLFLGVSRKMNHKNFR